MAVRIPLKLDGSDLKEMSPTEVNNIVKQVVYQYSLSPSVALSVVSSGGNLGTLGVDTRKDVSSTITHISSYQTPGALIDVSVTYATITQTDTPGSPTTDNAKTWPVYYTSAGNIQAMNLDDVKDTFLHPAIDLLVSGSTGTSQGGTYHITTSSSGAVSSTPVFKNTQANTDAYSAIGMPEATGQFTTVPNGNYYLHKITGSDTSYVLPMYITGSNDLREYATATFEGLLQEWIQYTAASSGDGYELNYSYSTGTNRGSGMQDTRLGGETVAQYTFSANDYKAQRFPAGSAQSQNTYYLKINKS